VEEGPGAHRIYQHIWNNDFPKKREVLRDGGRETLSKRSGSSSRSMNWSMAMSGKGMPIGTFSSSGSRIGARHESDR
jgi:hypothetical protein